MMERGEERRSAVLPEGQGRPLLGRVNRRGPQGGVRALQAGDRAGASQELREKAREEERQTDKIQREGHGVLKKLKSLSVA